MQQAFTEDQEQFRQVVARFLADKSSVTEVRRLMMTSEGYDAVVWQQLCNEMGLAGLHFPESYGGFGFGPIELGIACEEMGKTLYSGPFFSSAVMAGYALLIGGDEPAKERLLPGIAGGSTRGTLVLDSLDSPVHLGRGLRVKDGNLNGEASLVLDAAVADLLVVIAGTDRGLGLFEVSAPTSELNIAPVETMDLTRKLGCVKFDAVQVRELGELDQVQINTLWDHLSVALSHEMIGGAQHLLDTTIDYTQVRYQFGRPIGSFQALKHRCADLLMELEIAKALTHHAAFALAAGGGDAWVASMAKAAAADVYLLAAREAIQMRGGIGFTWEEDTHLWFKRAKSSEVFLGTPSMHRERVITQMEAAA